MSCALIVGLSPQVETVFVLFTSCKICIYLKPRHLLLSSQFIDQKRFLKFNSPGQVSQMSPRIHSLQRKHIIGIINSQNKIIFQAQPKRHKYYSNFKIIYLVLSHLKTNRITRFSVDFDISKQLHYWKKFQTISL